MLANSGKSKLVTGGVRTRKELTVVTIPPRFWVGKVLITVAENRGEIVPNNNAIKLAKNKIIQILSIKKPAPTPITNIFATIPKIKLLTFLRILLVSALPKSIKTVISPESTEIMIACNPAYPVLCCKNKINMGVNPPNTPLSRVN